MTLELGRHGVQAAVIKVYESCGCVVVRIAQSYRRGQRRNPGTAGVPDLYVFPPLRQSLAPDRWKAFWHETKADEGAQRPEQITFEQRCRDRGVSYVLGGVPEAIAHLRDIGVAV